MNEALKNKINEAVDVQVEELLAIKKYLYENPEIGGTEKLGSARLIEYIKSKGFEVTEQFHNIDYCFRACYDSGKEGPVIGFTAEYDALPDIGHGCGHNIIATAPTGAAVALKDLVDEVGGKVILYGTPAEENLVKKCQLADEGAFDELDVCLTIHPNPTNIASCATTAVDALQIEFYGKSSHAGAYPELGINALDAAVHFYTLIGFEKQYIKGSNVYGVFVDGGGKKCSVIPDHASIKYLLRAPNMQVMNKIRDMFQRCARAACEAVGTTYEIWNNEPGNKNVVSNDTMSKRFNEYYEGLGGGFMPEIESGASTDVGDVSQVVPTIMPWVGLDLHDVMLHSREFAEATMTPAGDKVMELSAKAMALTAADVLMEPEFLAAIKAEFEEAKKSF